MDGLTSKRILKRRDIVDFHDDEAIGPDRFEELSDVACCHRIARFGLPILARICKIRDYRRNGGSSVLATAGQEEKELAQLVVAGRTGRPVEAMDDVDIVAAHADERPRLVLPIFEIAFLVWVEVRFQRSCHTDSETLGTFQGEQAHTSSPRLPALLIFRHRLPCLDARQCRNWPAMDLVSVREDRSVDRRTARNSLPPAPG